MKMKMKPRKSAIWIPFHRYRLHIERFVLPFHAFRLLSVQLFVSTGGFRPLVTVGFLPGLHFPLRNVSVHHQIFFSLLPRFLVFQQEHFSPLLFSETEHHIIIFYVTINVTFSFFFYRLKK